MSFVFKYENYWPKSEIDLRTITGAMESGCDLFLIGSFGGFGGCIFYVHSDLEKAKTHAQEINNRKDFSVHVSIYRMKFKIEDEMLNNQETEG